MNISRGYSPYRMTRIRTSSEELSADYLPGNIQLLSTDDRDAVVRLYQQQRRIFRPDGELERSYVGYITMALFRYQQLTDIESQFLKYFPAGSTLRLDQMSDEGRKLFDFKSDRDLQKLWKSLHRDQKHYQDTYTRWQKILWHVQRNFPGPRL
jgi:hypothetical protein